MNGACLVIVPGLREDNTHLQPWRYVLELASRESRRREVILLTDGTESASDFRVSGMRVIQTKHLRPWHFRHLIELIRPLAPTDIWWSVSPLSFAYIRLLTTLPGRLSLLLTGPIYHWRELFQALRHGAGIWNCRSHLFQRAIPRWLFARFLNAKRVWRVIVQSERNAERLEAIGVASSRILHVPVGLPRADRQVVSGKEMRNFAGIGADKTVFCFSGGTQNIRGLQFLLQSFAALSGKSAKAHLLVLARGEDAWGCARILRRARRLGIAEAKITIIGARFQEQAVDHDLVLRLIDAADVVVKPFLLVPSDLPITPLEAMGRGKPLIVTNVDGLPELVQGHGQVLSSISKNALCAAIARYVTDEERLHADAQASVEFMQEYPDWDEAYAVLYENRARAKKGKELPQKFLKDRQGGSE